VETETTEKYTREKVIFRNGPDDVVPGYLYLPLSGSAPYPCVLALHPGGGQKEWVSGKDLDIVGKGIAVLALDAQYHGERRKPGIDSRMRALLEKGMPYLTRQMVIETVISYRRGMDYLASRSDVDTSRIGLIGGSFGAHVGFLLTSVDHRVKAAAFVAGPVGRVGVFKNLPQSIVAMNFAAAVGNTPVLMQIGRNDKLNTVNEVEQLFERIPGPDKKLIWYDAGHGLPRDETVPITHSWLVEYLGQTKPGN